jgi:DNA-binding PadR family transcriptional regulator
MAQLVAMVQDAGLVEVHTDEQGREAYRLTEQGVRVGHMLRDGERKDAGPDTSTDRGTSVPSRRGTFSSGEAPTHGR